jgi:HAD superfamily hydrolase (TIGR01662 family)
MTALIIFDVDGTLAKIYTLRVLPGVKEFFDLVYRCGCEPHLKIAIATNQGGVGLRYWMEQEDFGNPDKYPSEESIEERMRGLIDALGAEPELPVYVSYRYQNREGRWGPVPPERENAPRWDPSWRKPASGMLLQAMQDFGVSPEQTLFVGDSEDDQNAAQAAGCHFTWANEFFSREWSGCDDLNNLV